MSDPKTISASTLSLSRHDIDAILFDIGRVILDIDPALIGRHWLATLQSHSINLPRDASSTSSGKVLGSEAEIAKKVTGSETYHAYECGKISDGAFFDFVAEVLGLSLPIDTAVREVLRDGWNAIFLGKMPNVHEMLSEATQIAPVYAFSNTNQAHCDHFLPRFEGLFSDFSKIYLSQEVGMRKPHKEAFDAVVADMGVAPGRVLFFDDLAENIEGARRAGLHAVLVDGPDVAPDFIAALAAH